MDTQLNRGGDQMDKLDRSWPEKLEVTWDWSHGQHTARSGIWPCSLLRTLRDRARKNVLEAAAPLGDFSLRPPGWFQGSVYHVFLPVLTSSYTLSMEKRGATRSGTWNTCVLWGLREMRATWTNLIISYKTPPPHEKEKNLHSNTRLIYFLLYNSNIFLFLWLFN